jgi:hypothetical protein
MFNQTMAALVKAMKHYFNLMLVVAGVVLSGCATDKNGLVLDTAGPAPDQSSVANSTNGTLVVYSAFKRNADFDSRAPNSPEYSDYKIFTDDGKLLQRVHNNSGTILQGTVPVELSPGKYHIMAHANGYGRYVVIPVVIAAGQTTILHLEGGGFWPDESAFNKTNAVRLPDGLVIGWKAAPNL